LLEDDMANGVLSALPHGVRLAVSPLSWANDVLEDLGADIPLEACLADAASIGYQGVELGRKFPRQADTLGLLLERHGLALASGWHSGFLAERSVEAEIEAVAPHARLLKALGAEVMVYGPCGRMAPGAPLDISMAKRVTLGRDEAADYADRLAEFERRLIGEYGLRMGYHHHLMMVVETFDEVSRVFDRARCGLLVDTGHAAAAGFDYAKLIDRFGDLITHIHLKDVRTNRMARVRSQDLSFNQGVRSGMFTVPGDGELDFAPIAQFVKTSGYRGWLVVEAEQDPARPEAEPKAATTRAFNVIASWF
jgi:inosose dehydratase